MLVHETMRGTIHGFQTHGLRLVVILVLRIRRTNLEHVLTVMVPMTGLTPYGRVQHERSRHFIVSARSILVSKKSKKFLIDMH
mgnify:CR=1